LETIRDYNALSRLFLGYACSFAIGIFAIAGQFLASDFPKQGVNLIDSFFIYALVAQFTHLGWFHLCLNLAGFSLLVWGFSKQRGLLEWLWIQLFSLLWVAFYLTNVEHLAWYCGLSGAVHFQFAACLLLAFYRIPIAFNTSWPLWVMLTGLICKLIFEWYSVPNADWLVGGPIAFEAHRGGTLGGILMGAGLIAFDHWKIRNFFS
jgi:hypothetical protein